jgi:hypothetical protein
MRLRTALSVLQTAYRVGGNVIAESREQVPTVALRPHHDLYAQILVAILALVAPIFVVLYWLAIPADGWRGVLAAQLVLTALLGVVVASVYLMATSVDGERCTRRTLLGRLRVVPFEQVGRVIRLDLVRSGSLTVQPQLFLLDHEGALLLRMRGQCWSPEAMEGVIHRVGAPILRVTEPMTLLELNHRHPHLLSWFERVSASLISQSDIAH